MSAGYARRACLVLHAAGLTSEATSWRELAARSAERERRALLEVADANEWLAGELTRMLATSAESVDLDTRHALPDRGEVDEPAEGDAFTSAWERADHDRSPAGAELGFASSQGDAS